MPSGIRNPAGNRIPRLDVAEHYLKVPQRRASGFTTGVAADYTAALLPAAALAFDLAGWRAVLGSAADSGRRKPASESAASKATLMVSPIAFISASDTWFT